MEPVGTEPESAQNRKRKRTGTARTGISDEPEPYELHHQRTNRRTGTARTGTERTGTARTATGPYGSMCQYGPLCTHMCVHMVHSGLMCPYVTRLYGLNPTYKAKSEALICPYMGWLYANMPIYGVVVRSYAHIWGGSRIKSHISHIYIYI